MDIMCIYIFILVLRLCLCIFLVLMLELRFWSEGWLFIELMMVCFMGVGDWGFGFLLVLGFFICEILFLVVY